MKRIVVLVGVAIVLLSSCATILGGLVGQLFPEVDPPESADASMAVVELIAYTEGEAGTDGSRTFNNLVNSGFYPVVTDGSGNELHFGNIDALADAGMVYYAENIDAGTYTLKGFRYLWMTHDDYMNTPIKELKFDGQNDAEWQQTSFYPLPEPLTFSVGASTIESFGRFNVHYTLKDEGDERYSIDKWEYVAVSPDDKEVLSIMKDWRSGNWTNWNARNPRVTG